MTAGRTPTPDHRSGADSGLPPAAYALACADLPGIGPKSLGALFASRDPEAAWRAVLSGAVERPPARSGERGAPWREVAEGADLAVRWETVRRSRIGVTWRGAEGWPAVFDADPQPPGALFWRGDLGALRRPSVAIVGTRHATAEGRAVAYDLGRDLAGAGVTVVSGLALGIDGAAHAGALAARPSPGSARLSAPPGGPDAGRSSGPSTEGVDGWSGCRPAVARTGRASPAAPVGVAASGVDVPYPRRHAALWARVAATGVVLSETPPGGAASTWRFPWRNRIIAALADLVVVVESRERGGSMHTAEAALARGIDLGVVPGPVRSPVSAGTNQLLHDGAHVIRHAGDVLDVLGLGASWDPDGGAASLPLLGAEERTVLDAVDWRATAVGRVVERTGFPPTALARHLEHLAAMGLVVDEGGRWSRCSPDRRRAGG